MIQRLIVYRSLIGSSKLSSLSSAADTRGCCANILFSLFEDYNNSEDDSKLFMRHTKNNNNNDQSTVGGGRRRFAFDGALLSFDQLIDTAETMGLSSSSSSSSPLMSSSLLFDIRLICQLEPTCANDVSEQLCRLAEFLDKMEEARTNINTNINNIPSSGRRKVTSSTKNDSRYPHRHHNPILDMVVIKAPSQIINDNDEHNNSMDKTLEYLSSTLPAASIFLESISPGSVATSGNAGDGDGDVLGHTTMRRSNAHGRPLRRHVHGVSHHLPGVDLNTLTDIADIFPPTRFVLDPTNLCTDGHKMNSDDDDDDDDDDAAPSMSNTYGLSKEIEAVVQNTDIIRVSPSTFQPQKSSFVEGNSNENDDNVDKIIKHGLFGTGTLFGEVWCAQELDGAHETYVIICNNDDENDDENGDDDGDNVSNENDRLSSLAIKIHTAFEESTIWRAGAEIRREKEIKEATIAAKNDNAGRSSWMQGRYSPEIVESARILGLITTDLESPITTDMIKKRWRALAFQSHPDTAGGSDVGSGTNKKRTSREDKPSFSVLRQHYHTLLAAAKQDTRTDNNDTGVPKY